MRTRPSRRFSRTTAALLLVFAALGIAPRPGAAQLAKLETEDLRLIYIEGAQSYLVPHVARCFENSMRFQRKLFDFEPSEKVTVILTDFADYGNAGAGAVPRNGLLIEIAPMNFAYETYPSNERMNTLMNHELVHVANFDRPSGSDRFWRSVFGGKPAVTAKHPETILYSYFTAPRTAAPRWYHEGIAVFVETQMAGGLGRAQGSYDEMVWRAMVRDDSHFYTPLGLVAEGTKVDFQVELNSYLYGSRFMSYLADQYGPDLLLDWVTRTSGSKAYYADQFKRVYGESMSDVWRDWILHEHLFQDENLARLREYEITEHQDISDRALGAVSRAYYDPQTRRIYAGLNYPGIVAHIGAIDVDTGEVEVLTEIKGPMMYSVTSLGFDQQARKLFYTTDNSAYRDLMEYDLETGKSRKLMKDFRAGELVVNPADHSIWGIRHLNGFCTLVRIPFPYEEWEQIHTFDYGRTVYDLDISPDGELLTCAIGEINGAHSAKIARVDTLMTEVFAPVAEFSFNKTIPSNFVFTADSKTLIGSSYYTGVSNLWRYDVEADSLDCLTNAETGYFRPIPIEGDSLLTAFRYTGGGFVPTRVDARPLEDVNAVVLYGANIRKEYLELEEWRVGSPMSVPLDSMITYEGDYHALRSMEMEAIYPIVEGYKDYAAVGLATKFSDPISMYQLELSASYTPDSRLASDQRFHASLDFNRYDWSVWAGLNSADFYDLFGPTKTSLKGYYLGVGWKKNLIYDQPRSLDFAVDVSYFGGLERVPDYQNIPTFFEELFASNLHLGYKNLRFSMGAVDYEKGIKWGLNARGNRVRGDYFGQLRGDLDMGLPLFSHSSIWLRSAGGWSPGPTNEPLANFFFGHFGNNYVDHLDAKRYRHWYAFPGLEINEVGGVNFGKLMLDYNLPPLRFRSAGKPAFYASWIRMSIFGSGLVTNMELGDDRTEVANVGTQLDMRMTLLARLDMTLSFGYASAWRDQDKRRDEWMISLKLL